MVDESVSNTQRGTSATLAPRWHTAALVSLLLAVAVTGLAMQRHAASAVVPSASANATPSRILAQYLPLLIVNWGLVLYCARVFRGHNALPELLGTRWRSLRRFGADIALAVVCFFVIAGLELVASRLFPVRRNAAVSALLPSTEAERLTWLAVAVSVGFCEEIIYRGYLQTQLAAFTRSRAFGVGLQAVLFGIAHLEQGPASALRIGMYGLALGVLAASRGSLLPGILCHIGIDLVSGLLR